MSTFLTRLKSSILLMAVTVTLMILGGLPLFLGIAVISVVGLSELYRVMGFSGTGLTAAGIALALVYLVMLRLLGSMVLTEAWAAAALLALLCVYVLTFPKYDAGQITAAFFGLFYVVVTLSYIYLIREMEGGKLLVWLVFIAAWGCDTMAYCTGILIGKHHMTPALSPKKTWEGAAGGVIGAAAIGALYGWIFRGQLPMFDAPVRTAALICGAGAPLSMIGDLAASAIKRNRNVKDYGNLIPGHGGILDRFDSVIVTAPVIYYLAALLAH